MTEEKTTEPITMQDVERVAISLFSDGEEVSVRKVRAELGRGSFTTIRKLIDEWKARQVALKLPDSLISEINNLYLDIWQKAVKETEESTNQKTLEIIDKYRKTTANLHEAEAEIEKLESLIVGFQNNELKQERNIKRISKKSSELSAEVDRLRKANAVLQEKYDFLQKTFTKKTSQENKNLSSMIEKWSQGTGTDVTAISSGEQGKATAVVTRRKPVK